MVRTYTGSRSLRGSEPNAGETNQGTRLVRDEINIYRRVADPAKHAHGQFDWVIALVNDPLFVDRDVFAPVRRQQTRA